MVSRLREEGMGVIPRAFSSGMGTEVDKRSWRIQCPVLVGARCNEKLGWIYLEGEGRMLFHTGS